MTNREAYIIMRNRYSMTNTEGELAVAAVSIWGSLAMAGIGFWVGGAIGLFSTLSAGPGTALLTGIITGVATAVGAPICAIAGAAVLGGVGLLVGKGSKGAAIGALAGAVSGPFVGYNYAYDKLEQAYNTQTSSIQSEFKTSATYTSIDTKNPVITMSNTPKATFKLVA